MDSKVNSRQKARKEITIKQDVEDDLLLALLKEYELTSTRSAELDNRVLQIVAGAAAVLSFMFGYVLNQPKVSPEIVWLVPLISIIVFTYLIWVMYNAVANIWNSRIITFRINTLLGQITHIHSEADSPEGWFFSTTRGSGKIRLIYTIFFIAGILLSILIFHISFTFVYNTSHIQGSLFMLIYGTLSFLLLIASLGIITDLPEFYRAYMKGYQTRIRLQPENAQIPGYSELRLFSSTRLSNKAFFAFIVPRAWDVIAKGPFFIYGFVIAFCVTGLSAHNVSLINALFSTTATNDWKTGLTVPIWAVCALCILYFFVEEILLQQAKLIWDDIRDIQRDKILLQNSRRAIATGLISIRMAIWQMLIRWIAAFIFGYLLGGITLLTVFFLISLHQALYVLWAKRSSALHQGSARRQISLLFFVSFNSPLRYLAGVVAVVGTHWSLTPYILFFVLFYFCSFGAMAAFWKMEAQYYRRKGQVEAFRSQSPYYEISGEFWQYVGLVAAVLVGAFIIIVHLASSSCSSGVPVLQIIYRYCTENVAIYSDIKIIYSIFTVPVTIVVFSLISMLLIAGIGGLSKVSNQLIGSMVSRRVKSFFAQMINVSKNLILQMLYLLTIGSFFIAPFIWHDISALFWGFLLLNMAYLLMYHGMTYEDYTLESMRKRLPFIGMAWYVYLLKPHQKLGLKELIGITFSNVNIDDLKRFMESRD